MSTQNEPVDGTPVTGTDLAYRHITMNAELKPTLDRATGLLFPNPGSLRNQEGMSVHIESVLLELKRDVNHLYPGYASIRFLVSVPCGKGATVMWSTPLAGDEKDDDLRAAHADVLAKVSGDPKQDRRHWGEVRNAICLACEWVQPFILPA